MNSRKPNFNDTLGDLIRQTLETQVDAPEPSDEIWKQIEGDLQPNKAAEPSRRRVLLSSPVVQAVFILLLIIMGGFGLRTKSVSDDAEPILVAQISPEAPFDTGYFIDEYSISSGMQADQDKFEQYSLKRFQRFQGYDSNRKNYTADMFPLDIIPHPLSPQGRLLNAGPPKRAFEVDIGISTQFDVMLK